MIKSAHVTAMGTCLVLEAIAESNKPLLSDWFTETLKKGLLVDLCKTDRKSA
ncbi:hypothetical protein QUA54_04090 [Microcoleus sp. MOSTC5]|uniref:hypothetical protein n=1 Tax=Microcoleus sp. MOSTC5 TaxID=3055378 RepID=UPI002FD34D67